MQVLLALEGIQDGEKIYEVTRIENELDLMDVDNKRIERLQQQLLQGVRGSLIVIDLMPGLVDLGPFDEELYDLLGFVDLEHNMDSEGLGHVIVAVEQDHEHAFVGPESFVGRVLDHRVLRGIVEGEAQEGELGNLLQGDAWWKLEWAQVDDL